MMDESTRSVLNRARELERLEAAALALSARRAADYRALLAAALAALAMLVPSAGAARGILI